MSEVRRKLLELAMENERRIAELETIIKKYVEMSVLIPDSITEAMYRCQLTASNIVLLLQDEECEGCCSC